MGPLYFFGGGPQDQHHAGLGLQKTRRQIAKTGQIFDEWNADANPHLVDRQLTTR